MCSLTLSFNSTSFLCSLHKLDEPRKSISKGTHRSVGVKRWFCLGCINTLGSTETTFHHDKRNGTAQIRGSQCYLGWWKTCWETAAACWRCDWCLSDVQNRWQIMQSSSIFTAYIWNIISVSWRARDTCHGRMSAQRCKSAGLQNLWGGKRSCLPTTCLKVLYSQVDATDTGPVVELETWIYFMRINE